MNEMLSSNKNNNFDGQSIKKFANEIRITQLKSFQQMGYGHIGGSMSISDLLAVLYGAVMKIDPKHPDSEDRDFLVLSKGHCAIALYATLALKGYFPFEEIYTANRPGTHLPSHCDRNKTPGIDMSTGSLGQGISTAAGMAKALKLRKKSNHVYVILGDGECDEGQIWEGLLFSAQHKLDNLTVFVDFNQKQLDGYLKDVCDLGDLRTKFREFGFHAEYVDGHDCAKIYAAVKKAHDVSGRPTAIILKTIKGKGCCFAEDLFLNHYMAFDRMQADEAINKLQEQL